MATIEWCKVLTVTFIWLFYMYLAESMDQPSGPVKAEEVHTIVAPKIVHRTSVKIILLMMDNITHQNIV